MKSIDERFEFLVVKYLDDGLSLDEEAELSVYLLNNECEEYFEKSKAANTIIEEGMRDLMRRKRNKDREEDPVLAGIPEEVLDEIDSLVEEHEAREKRSDRGEEGEADGERSRQEKKMLKILHRKMVFRRRTWQYAVAAGIIVLVFASSYFLGTIHKPTNHELYLCYYKPSTYIVHRSENKDNPVYANAISAYKQENYASSAVYCREILSSVGHEPEALLLYGLNLMALDSISRALEQFDEIISLIPSKDGVLYVYALWYSGLCHLEMDNPATALQVFERLREEKNIFAGQVRVEEVVRRIRGERN